MKSNVFVWAQMLLLLIGCSSNIPKDIPKTMPEFTFYTLDEGKEVNRMSLAPAGNVVFIFFDPGCSHCQKETKLIGERYGDFKNVTFYFISQQERPLVRDFMQTYAEKLLGKSNVHIWIDSNYSFLPLFYPKQYPALYVYSQKRQLQGYLDGENSIDKIIEVVNKGL